jgi:hypothetical protein
VAYEKFSLYNRQTQAKKGTPFLTTEEYCQMLEEAGFVDLQVTKKFADHGTYSNGMLIETGNLTSQDPEAKRAGQIARFAHGAVFPIIAMTFTQIEDLDERRAFIDRCIAAACSGTEPHATCMYVHLPSFANGNRHQIVARKPPV